MEVGVDGGREVEQREGGIEGVSEGGNDRDGGREEDQGKNTKSTDKAKEADLYCLLSPEESRSLSFSLLQEVSACGNKLGISHKCGPLLCVRYRL